MKEIAPDVVCLGPWGRSQTNVYLVRADRSWVLVDAGWRSDSRRIEEATRSLLGINQHPMAILLTHVHPDHAGAAKDLAAAWGCPVFVHPDELGIARGDFSAMWRCAGPLDRYLILPAVSALGRRRRDAMLATSSLQAAVRGLESGGTIPDLPGWEWVHTPGHTLGHVAYFRRPDRVLISGDAVVTLRVNTAAGILLGRAGLSGPPWYTTWSQPQARASIRSLARLEPAVIAGGHGRPITHASAEQLATFARSS